MSIHIKYVNISVGWKGNKDSIYIKWCRAADFYCVFLNAEPVRSLKLKHCTFRWL